MPSARWSGRQWIDEQGIVYPEMGPQGLKKCPRRIGIVSTGLIIRGSETVDLIREFTYECVILDEAHRARRFNLGPMHRDEKASPNNLLRFLMDISSSEALGSDQAHLFKYQDKHSILGLYLP